ncbi:MAG: AAA family ATPase [Thermodesulfobacteriota bacterium]|nr:AAA family ATPase [Thermodesulfobacteriota bacterium]
MKFPMSAEAVMASRLKQLPEEPYQGFDFVTTKLDDVIFGLREGTEGQLVDARILLSDGTLRCLAVLTALETAEEDSRVIIEELDNGLHPSRVKVLTAAIEDCCERRKLNVMVTTHNPATLDALSQDQLKGVVICAWDQPQQAFKLVRLFDLPRHVELLERGSLGDLMTRRVFEQYLAPTFEKDRREEALDWLHSLP